MDIDNFKALNDKFNQTVADIILKKLGINLKSDSRITDSIYRQHEKGDEFIIITKDTNLGDATTAANRKRVTISKTGISVDGYNNPFF